VKIDARDRAPFFQEERDAGVERKAGKDPSKNAHPTENGSHSRRIKSVRLLDVDYREKILAVRY